MNYILFLKKIEQNVKSKLDASYEVRHHSVLKNNGLELDALIITKNHEAISPNIYLEYYYDCYCNGASLDEVGDQIIETYYQAMKNNPIPNYNYLDFEKLRTHIFYRLVNYEKNETLLKQIPHISYLDLAMTFHCKIGEDASGVQSYCISHAILKAWDISLAELQEIAMENTPKLFKPRIASMEQIIQKLTLNENRFDEINDMEYAEYINLILDELPQNVTLPMYVITNQNGINGAATILYPNLLKEFAHKFQSNLFLLPSSIHECATCFAA